MAVQQKEVPRMQFFWIATLGEPAGHEWMGESWVDAGCAVNAAGTPIADRKGNTIHSFSMRDPEAEDIEELLRCFTRQGWFEYYTGTPLKSKVDWVDFRRWLAEACGLSGPAVEAALEWCKKERS